MPKAAKEDPDLTLYLEVWLGVNSTQRLIDGLVNGSQYASSAFNVTPTLFEIHDGVDPSALDLSRNAYVLPTNGTVRVILNTTLGPGAHPYHMVRELMSVAFTVLYVPP